MPTPRAVSHLMLSSPFVVLTKFNSLLMQFGQFLSHDLTRGPKMAQAKVAPSPLFRQHCAEFELQLCRLHLGGMCGNAGAKTRHPPEKVAFHKKVIDLSIFKGAEGQQSGRMHSLQAIWGALWDGVGKDWAWPNSADARQHEHRVDRRVSGVSRREKGMRALLQKNQ